MSKTYDVDIDGGQEKGNKGDEELTPLRAALTLFTENPRRVFS